MTPPTETLVCAGYTLGHPATVPDPQRLAALAPVLAALEAAGRWARPALFFDLAAARDAAAQLGGVLAPQGLWVPTTAVARLRREVRGTALDRMLAANHSGPLPPVVAGGHDVLGFGGDLVLSFVREDAGQDLCHRLALPIDPPPFLPDAATARRLVTALERDELGAPVLWVRCWRTVHAAID